MAVVGKPKLMRKINRELLLGVLREKQYVTNSELTKKTGLSRRTVNLIISSLMESGIVAEAGYGDSTSEGGKKPVIYQFIPDSFYAIGCMIRDIKAFIGICNLNGEILFRDEITIEWDKGRDHVSRQILGLIKSTIDKVKIDLSKFLGVGIGLPGIIDSENGTIKTLTRHEGWEEFSLAKVLQKELKMPVEIKNENHIRVLGEKWFGLAKDYRDFVTIITTNDGIGAGVVLNNKLMSSKNCLFGEVGHIKTVGHGTGFKELMNFEHYLGLKHINQVIHDNIKHRSYPGSPIKKIADQGVIPFKDLFDSYNSGDEFSSMVVDKITVYLATLIEIIVCTYDPELIIIQGKYSTLNDDYFKEISKDIKRSLYPRVNKEIAIKRTTQAKEMSIIGAAGIIFDEISI